MNNSSSSAYILSGQKFPIGKIRVLFNLLLTEFLASIEEDPVPMEQEMRAGSIAWIIAYMPEVVGKCEVERIKKAVHETRKRQDYYNSFWYKTLWLDVACFLLSDSQYDLAILIANIDHHNSALRSAVHPPLGLVATRVSLDDQDIYQRIRSCLEKRYFFNDSLMCILWAFKDKARRKVEFVKRMREEIDQKYGNIDVLEKIVDGEVISNSLISDEFSLIQRYLFCRILDPELDGNVDECLVDEFVFYSHQMWMLMNNHPLWVSQIYFDMTE